ncbi:MAG: winged helix DNA-binding domain-containing protein [Actinomycetota bacterium]|nr:winged helix DNA-binding domain-containing protein [Actinomycetota bacterium]
MAVATGRSTLSERQLNRALLARQSLLERANKSIPKMLEAMGGLQAQYAPSMYIGLWSRMSRFDRDDLTRALERRSVVQGTLLRSTIHLVSAHDYAPFAAAIGDERRKWWLKTHKHVATAKQMEAAARKLRKALGSKTMQRSEIDDLLGKPIAGGIGLWIDLVRVPPSGTWEHRRADLYAAADRWIDQKQISGSDATKHLVKSYLRGFGPAPVKDIAGWAGIGPKAVAATVEEMRLRRFSNEQGDELVDLPRAPLPDPDVPAPVRFLPTWDATLLVHARRTGILPEEYRSLVFDPKTPHSVPVFLVDGRVAGKWRYVKGAVQIEAFARLSRAAKSAVEEEADALAEFHS